MRHGHVPRGWGNLVEEGVRGKVGRREALLWVRRLPVDFEVRLVFLSTRFPQNIGIGIYLRFPLHVGPIEHPDDVGPGSDVCFMCPGLVGSYPGPDFCLLLVSTLYHEPPFTFPSNAISANTDREYKRREHWQDPHGCHWYPILWRRSGNSPV